MTGKGRDTADITLAAVGWSGLFQSVVTGDEVDRPKPDPQGPLRVARELIWIRQNASSLAIRPPTFSQGKLPACAPSGPAGTLSTSERLHPCNPITLRGVSTSSVAFCSATECLSFRPVPSDLDTFSASIDGAMIRDRHRLRRRLREIEELARDGRLPDDAMRHFAADLERSQRHREMRQKNVPAPKYPPELPVVERRQEIADAIAANQVVVLCGETGSGKTTQLPKICLELGRGVSGMIGHTQPRRIAARSVAMRIAQELAFARWATRSATRCVSATSDAQNTYIKLMTDGILLAETQSDRFLNSYDTIIIDEAHERSLNIDFLLGYLKQLLPKRRT